MTAQNIPTALMPEEEVTSAYIPWFRVFPDRFREERVGLEAMGFELDVEQFRNNQSVVFTGSLPEYPDRRLILSFPSAYPSIAPELADDGLCPILPRHQRPGTRVYCLFGPNGENWYAGLSGIDVFSEVKRLIDDVLIGDQQPEGDPYPEPFSAQALTKELGTILVPPDVSELLPDDLTQASEGSFQLVYSAHLKPPSQVPPATRRGMIFQAKFKQSVTASKASDGYRKIVTGKESKGHLTYLPYLKKPILDWNGFIDALSTFSISPRHNFPWQAVIFPEQSGNRDETRYSWLVFMREPTGRFTPLHTVTYRSMERESRIPGLHFLSTKRVAIIGCGAIGSKVAASLASSGVSKFVLIDREILEPANAIRHECGVDDFAISKAHALEARLASLNPDTLGNCLSYQCNPFSKLLPEPMELIWGKLRDCDLIVNATGSQGLSRSICEVANHFKRPSIHASVTNGAWSGEVFRQLPGRSSCWQCFREAFPDSPPGQEVPLGHVFAPGCDQPTFTGTGYELDVVAGLATGFIVDTLRGECGVGASEYDGDYLLWQSRDSLGKLLQRTAIHKVPPRIFCPCFTPTL
jgi:molybdopterin/thiamine biosynthesis adenylyltransferase